LSFVFIRSTAGKDKIDSKFKENWKAAKERQLIRGAYHYYRPNENSIVQAENFINTVTLEPGDFPPVLDIEQLPKKQSLDSLKVGLKRWLDKVEKHYKVKPIIYSGESYYKDFLKKEFSEYPFWIANYNFWRNQPDSHWLLWQFTEKAQISGINGTVDVNVFNGDLIYLRSKLVY
ncbi:MAG: glycoside hydrolase family 25 protein, partial [Flavobacterium sp.]|nr:glycoside hydrolase family 25 protein [Flavobacterium sp.]